MCCTPFWAAVLVKLETPSLATSSPMAFHARQHSLVGWQQSLRPSSVFPAEPKPPIPKRPRETSRRLLVIPRRRKQRSSSPSRTRLSYGLSKIRAARATMMIFRLQKVPTGPLWQLKDDAVSCIEGRAGHGPAGTRHLSELGDLLGSFHS